MYGVFFHWTLIKNFSGDSYENAYDTNDLSIMCYDSVTGWADAKSTGIL